MTKSSEDFFTQIRSVWLGDVGDWHWWRTHRHWWRSYRHWWRSYRHWWRNTGTGGAVCKGATLSVEQPGGRGFKPRLRSLLD